MNHIHPIILHIVLMMQQQTALHQELGLMKIVYYIFVIYVQLDFYWQKRLPYTQDFINLSCHLNVNHVLIQQDRGNILWHTVKYIPMSIRSVQMLY
uniref:Uncharacterized protein n=1 Tax=Panstrongylus lignarius TaxID=156445 RepID=A0A224XR60_9HEMI